MTRVQRVITELRRRRVFRTAAIYVVAAWVAVQVMSLVFPAIGVPDSALLYVWLTALFLFPVAVVFAWFFDVSALGVARTPPAEADAAFDPSLRRTDYVILTALAIVSVAIVLQLTTRIEVASEITQTAVNPKSVAVLPLDNISGDSEQQYFVSGMQAAVIAGLSRIRALRVTSKASTLRYRDSGETLPEIGRQLGVAKIIEGSIYRFGDRVRLEVQLLDAQADEHVWSGTFEDELENIMMLQSRVAQAVARQVRVTLTADEQGQFDDAVSVNPAAFEAFLKGVFHVERFTPEDMRLAAGYFQQAVDLEPDYALGHWGLAKLCSFKTRVGLMPPDEARRQCLPPILKSLDLDPLLPEAHLGFANHMTWREFDWDRADAAFQRAIELNPSYAEARMFYSHYLGIVGRLEESTEQMRLALELDPLNPFVRGLYGVQLNMVDDFERAARVAEEVIASTPGFGFAYLVLATAYHLTDEWDRAIAAMANEFRHTLNEPHIAQALEASYDGSNYAEAILHTVDVLLERSNTEHLPPMLIAVLYERAGEIEKAIEWYEAAYREHDPDAPYIGVLSKTAEMTANPRFHRLLRDMKLDYWADRFSRAGD